MCEKLHYVKNMWNWFHKLPWVSHTCEILLACEKNMWIKVGIKRNTNDVKYEMKYIPSYICQTDQDSVISNWMIYVWGLFAFWKH